MTMRLSEAIYLGSKLHKQAFRAYYNVNNKSEVTSTCAFGAAMVAVGELCHVGHATVLWPWINNRVKCPHCGGERAAKNIIMELNDSHRWSRERIADWVATVEPQEGGGKEECEEERGREVACEDDVVTSAVEESSQETISAQ